MRTPAVLVGQGIGDALGMPFETLGDDVHAGLATWDGSYQPGTWHKLPSGHWTDDTAMAECLATSLVSRNYFDGADVARRYLAWSQATPHGMGGTTRSAMGLLARGVPWTSSGIEFDNPYQVGSAPPMRAAPIGAFSLRRSAKQIYDTCRQDAYITHASHEAIAASFAVAIATQAALSGHYDRGLHTLLDVVTRGVLLAEKEDGLAKTQVREDLQRACIELNKGTPMDRIVPTFTRRGNARSITATAIYCAAAAESFREGVIAAVKLGGDADTRGAIAGAILGARFGLEGIPAEYKAGLLRFDDLARLDLALVEGGAS